jgi:alpha-tubulin suppressor-like RCC1 family protein
VTLQRFIGRAWKTIAHQKASSTSTFAFRLKAPKTPVGWVLRVTRAAGGGDKAGVSRTQHVRVVKPIFAVSASAALTAVQGQVVLTGKVGPRAGGKITVRELVGKIWNPLATGVLGKTGSFSVSVTLPVGAHTLQVFKPFSTTTAEGASKALHLAIVPPNPSVITTTLPRAVIGRPYSTTLIAALGTVPYTWSASGLPTGLTLSSNGLLSGKPVVAGSFTVATTVTDSGGRTGTTTLALTVAQTTLLAWGFNSSGEVGDGTTTTRSAQTPMQGLDAVTSIAANGGYLTALRVDGTVWATGDNKTGAIGLGPVLDTLHPMQVPGLTSVVAVAGGEENTYALTSDGTVWATGPNANGQLGNGTTTLSRIFQPVPGLGRAVAIAAGLEVAYAVLADGTLWAWGRNDHGQLGQGTIGVGSMVPVKVTGLSNVTSVASGGLTGLALLADGTVRAWGDNEFGEVGDGTLTTDVLTPVQPVGLGTVAALTTDMSMLDSFALKADGTVWSWGYNHDGEVGDGSTIDRHTPVQVPGLSGVVAISPGRGNIFAVLADGTLKAWGGGSNFQLGTGNENNQLSPVTVPGITSAVGAAGGEATGYALIAH